MFDESILSEVLGLETFAGMSQKSILSSVDEKNLGLSNCPARNTLAQIGTILEVREPLIDYQDSEPIINLADNQLVTGQADLTIDSLSSPSTAVVGGLINFSYRIRNGGTATAESSFTTFFLSKDNLLDDTDTLLGSDEIIALNQGVKRQESYAFSLNSSLALGEYYLLAQVDSNNLVLESNETNNLFVKSLVLTQADVVIQSLPSLEIVTPGQSFSFNYSIKNQGTAASNPSRTDFFLSQNDMIDEHDILLGTNYVGSLRPGTTKTQNVTLNISNEIQGGYYSLLARADSQNNILESNEANNVTIGTLQVAGESLPDLIISSSATPDTAESGTKISLNYTLTNQGKATAKVPFSTHIFWSQDTILDEKDSLLSSISEADLIANSSRSGTSSINLGSDLGAGTYYLIYGADRLNQVKESNENNNTIVEPITITKPVEQAISVVYSPISGYGTVNAAAAVAQASGKTVFADVANLGGNYAGADLIKAPEVWARGYTGQGIVVAVLDTGVDRNHTDLSPNIWTNQDEIAGNSVDDDQNGFVDDVYGWNFMANSNNTLDVRSHGTHVAGIIAAANNGLGVTGIAYNAKIMPVKVFNDKGSGTYDALIQGIYYAVDNGAKVINMSLAGSVNLKSLQYAIDYASSKGVIVVSAAGNAGAATPSYPAYYAISDGLAVGAVNQSNKRAGFSNKAGSNPEIAYVNAPGVNIYSTLPNNGYGSLSGTSMATPHVAGVVALMLSANPNLTDAQVRQILINTAIPLA